MKTLTLARHAKSSWKESQLADFDRPLNRRGQRDLPRMAQRLAAAGDPPQRVVTSPAVRALETARGLACALDLDLRALVTEPRVYEASREQLLSILRHQPDEVERLLLVGHSPGIADLAHALCGAPDGKFPTCGLLRLRLPVEGWADAAAGAGELEWFDYPKKAAGDGD